MAFCNLVLSYVYCKIISLHVIIHRLLFKITQKAPSLSCKSKEGLILSNTFHSVSPIDFSFYYFPLHHSLARRNFKNFFNIFLFCKSPRWFRVLLATINEVLLFSFSCSCVVFLLKKKSAKAFGVGCLLSKKMTLRGRCACLSQQVACILICQPTWSFQVGAISVTERNNKKNHLVTRMKISDAFRANESRNGRDLIIK